MALLPRSVSTTCVDGCPLSCLQRRASITHADCASLPLLAAQGINNTRWQILRWTGATLETLSTSPSLASKFVRSNLMLGSAPDYRTWRSGTIFYNELVPAQVLTVIEG